MVKSNKKEGEDYPSGEYITGHEIFGLVDIFAVDCTNELANIPEKIFLEYTFASNTELRTECIKAGFCGDRLPTTVKNRHAVVINQGDFVAVQIDSRNTAVSDNLSVSGTPVLVAVDGSDHLGFDFAHLVRLL